jgi:hypothetical protein
MERVLPTRKNTISRGFAERRVCERFADEYVRADCAADVVHDVFVAFAKMEGRLRLALALRVVGRTER